MAFTTCSPRSRPPSATGWRSTPRPAGRPRRAGACAARYVARAERCGRNPGLLCAASRWHGPVARRAGAAHGRADLPGASGCDADLPPQAGLLRAGCAGRAGRDAVQVCARPACCSRRRWASGPGRSAAAGRFERDAVQAQPHPCGEHRQPRGISPSCPGSRDNAAHSLLERTPDDSANRRSVLPEAFLMADEPPRCGLRLVEGLRVDERAAARLLAVYGPFAAIERLLMQAVKRGATGRSYTRSSRARRWPRGLRCRRRSQPADRRASCRPPARRLLAGRREEMRGLLRRRIMSATRLPRALAGMIRKEGEPR